MPFMARPERVIMSLHTTAKQSKTSTPKPSKNWYRQTKRSSFFCGSANPPPQDGPFRTCVIDPISRFCAYFPDINEAIKKRSHKLLDYDSLRAKVKRLVDKPSDDPTKLPRAEKEAAMAREIYEELNEQLTAELPQLIDLRVPYLDPSFEALVKIQLRFCKEGYERMAQVQQYLEPQVREDYAVVSNPPKTTLVFVFEFVRLTFRGHWIKRLSRFYSR
jgi:8-oxo-dGTP pyrophosphatase MutT (NUDIX family)